MSFREGLINARSHIVFIIALIGAMWLANVLEERLEVPVNSEVRGVATGEAAEVED